MNTSVYYQLIKRSINDYIIIGSLGSLCSKTSDIFRKVVHCVIRFDTEQMSDIKRALTLFGDDRQSHRAAGDFLYFAAKQKGNLDSREQVKVYSRIKRVIL